MVVPSTVRHDPKRLAGFPQTKAVVRDTVRVVFGPCEQESRDKSLSAISDAVFADHAVVEDFALRYIYGSLSVVGVTFSIKTHQSRHVI